MKKISKHNIYSLLLLCIAAGTMLLSSCRKDTVNVPVVTSVRNYAASPNDTLVQIINPGQWVVLEGKNLSGVTMVLFGSIPATINSAYGTDSHMVVQIPSIPFPSIPASKLNEITVFNKVGSTTYTINIIGAPIISRVRNSDASPKDTVIATIFSAQQIIIVGFNLKNATKIEFQGIAADLTKVTYTDTSVIVQVPADLSGSAASLSNTISYTTRFGTGNLPIKIIGPAIVNRISYEFPKEGDSVYLYGHNFVSVIHLYFGGAPVTSYKVLSDSVIGFTAPEISDDGGLVFIETRAGTFTSAYKVHDIKFINTVNFVNPGDVNILGNIEWGDYYFGYAWWGGSVTKQSSNPKEADYNAVFGAGGTGQYLEYTSNKLNGGAGDDGNAIRLSNDKNPIRFVPPANLNDPGTSWALKFEINVANPWNGSTLCIKSDTAIYMARYEPWKISSSKTISYITKGWQTVTIPLSEFRLTDATLGDGKGASITKVSDLFKPGKETGTLKLYLHNYGTNASTSFDAAFDNFRVVKR